MKTKNLRIVFPNAVINPLGDWTGGTDVDTGATNLKLGSDMADSVTGGGLHGKDLSKADVSVNIYAWLKAQNENTPVELCCAIGDDTVDGRPYSEIVQIARMRVKAVVMGGCDHLKAIEFLGFGDKTQSDFVSQLRRNSLVFRKRLHEMIVLSAVILAV